MGDSITRFVQEVFKTGDMLAAMNQVTIWLLPKQKHLETISQFRPICLSNVVVKIVSKIIANRLKNIIRLLTGAWQSNFVPGRQVVDNVVITQEFIHSLRRRKGAKGSMVVKIDLKKAYDRIDWGFLEQVLSKVGFGSMLVKVILSCLRNSELAVIWNGVRLDPFHPERGLRQGDPLSPYLSVLCMEVLGHQIQAAVQHDKWKACRASRGGPRFSHLFFADDLLLFGEASIQQATIMQAVLQQFCAESGQRVNSTKSKIWYSSNTPLGIIQSITNTFHIPSTCDLGKYLGFPLIHGQLTSHHFQYLVDKVQTRLAGWKSHLLSQAARLVLIQSVTATIPMYVMQCCQLPQRTILMLE